MNVLEETKQQVKSELLSLEMKTTISRIIEQVETGKMGQREAIYEAFKQGLDLAQKIFNE